MLERRDVTAVGLWWVCCTEKQLPCGLQWNMGNHGFVDETVFN